MKNDKGFTLIEVAIIVLIAGIFTGIYVDQYANFMYEKTKKKTFVAQALIKNSTKEFYKSFGRYPCPAKPELAVGDVDHGKEYCPGINGNPVLALNACIDGLCRTDGRDADDDGTFDGVLIGIPPYTTLGVPQNEILDGWKNRFTYAVSESQTGDTTYIPTYGALMIWKYDGSTPLQPTPGVAPSANPKEQGGNATAHYIILSHGETGNGAYTSQGNRIGTNCDPDAVSAALTPAQILASGKKYNELENCDNDYEFTWDSEAYSQTEGWDYYDDIFEYESTAPSDGTWNYSGVEEDVYTEIVGNIGIGTADPQYAVDVDGNISANDSVQSSGYCDDDGSDCFSSNTIGGGGIDCGNTAMTGIQYNNSVCSPQFPPLLLTGICNDGEYVVGVIKGTGQVQCRKI